MFASHQVDRVCVGVNELAEQVEQADVAGSARLRQEEPQRHAATIIGPVAPHRKHPNSTHPEVCERIEPACLAAASLGPPSQQLEPMHEIANLRSIMDSRCAVGDGEWWLHRTENTRLRLVGRFARASSGRTA
jgi:hypothetical protein